MHVLFYIESVSSQVWGRLGQKNRGPLDSPEKASHVPSTCDLHPWTPVHLFQILTDVSSDKPTETWPKQDTFWRPASETMEQWHLWLVAVFYFLALTSVMRWSSLMCFMNIVLSRGCWRVRVFWTRTSMSRGRLRPPCRTASFSLWYRCRFASWLPLARCVITGQILKLF